MGKVRVFDIIFENPRNVFHSGQKVIGVLKIENTIPVKAQRISIAVVGKGKVHWTKTTGSNEHRNTKHYRSEEYYVNQNIILVSPGHGEPEVTLPTGTHDLTFECPLPDRCPSSFEGAYGYVRYWCKANFARPWKFDIETKSAFTVLSHFDLNRNPQLAHHRSWELSRDVDCCCCVGGKVEVSLKIDKNGFVPGEPITFTGYIKNSTNTTVRQSVCKLEQSVEFYGISGAMFSSGTPKAKNCTNVVRQQILGEVIEPGQTQVWENARFFIPPLPPTGLEGANYINITYLLKLSIIPNWGDNIKILTPVVIGTVPIIRHVSLEAPAYNAIVTQPALSVPSAPFAPPEAAPVSAPSAPPPYDPNDMPPPSYEECVSGRVHIRDEDESEHVRGNLSFAPSYTYYDWFTHQQRFNNTQI